jgi:gliding motility-associated-like protein
LPYVYSWTTGSGTYSSQSIDQLSPGNYALLVTDKNGCTVSDHVTIAPGGSLQVSASHTDVSCSGGNNGHASLVISGAAPGYSVTWNNGATGPVLQNLNEGSYTATVVDPAGCTAIVPVVIAEPTRLTISIAATDEVCDNKNGKLVSAVGGGLGPYQYQWFPLSSGAQALTGLAAGNYALYVTDKNGCKDSLKKSIANVNPLTINLGTDTTICTPSMIVLSPGAYSKYTWQDGSSKATLNVTREGRYSVIVSDLRGCSASSSVNIVGDCGKIFFPAAFTPNGDNRNEFFGPLGNVGLIKDYDLTIFNRWGKLVFKTNNPLKKWNGRTGDEILTGAYVWYARYSTTLEPASKRQGTVVLAF